MPYLAIISILIFGNVSSDTILDSTDSHIIEAIEVGSNVPSFTLKDQYGELFNIDSVLGKKNLVIYFYPKDNTSGCTAQACSFRDQYEVFEEADAIIIGISGQSVESHLEFAKEYNLNFTLLSDTEDEVRELFDVPSTLFGIIPGRVTYIVNKEGKVVFTFDSQFNAEQHITEALQFLREMESNTSKKWLNN